MNEHLYTQPRQRKQLSQVFLTTDGPCKQIASKLRKWKVEHVLEIGPGHGILTKVLAKEGMHVTAVEKDERFYQFLQIDSELANVQLHRADILEFDWHQWLKDKDPSKTAVVGNIPYSISSLILKTTLDVLHQVRGAIFMVQWEFANRLGSKHDCKEYGSLSVFTQLRAGVDLLARVDKGCFKPVPKVDSALIALTPLTTPHDSLLLKKVESLTKTAFSKRRKKLSNAIKSFLTDKDLSKCPLDLNLRPEDLKPKDFMTLAKWLAD